jgi:NAD(P)-dependent dehydrogenase (short-subunit alcohol dehydrogenase family)
MGKFSDGMNLAGRVAMVTGGTRGIGKAIAARLAESGARLVINYVSDEETAARTVASLREQYKVDALAIRADVSRLSGAEKLVEGALEKFGRLDILVCNAGLWEGAAIEELTEEVWDRVLDVNLKGTWTICRACVPALKRQNGADRHRQFDRRAARRGKRLKLCGVKGWTDFFHQIARRRTGGARDYGQRRRAGVGRDRNDGTGFYG